LSFAFIAKKIVSAFVMPLSIGLVLLIVAIFYLYANNIKKAKKYLILGLVWIGLVSYVPFANYLIKPLETAYPKLTVIPTDVKYIVFLGGDRQNRGWEVLRLYHNIQDCKIITSGYAGRGKIAGAIKTANLLQSVGIPKDDILVYPKPQDTKQEALNIKKILQNKPFILVTSAYHMPRAMMIFRSIGLDPIAAPTDYKIRSSDKYSSLPDGYALKRTERAWHEYLGIIWFKLKEMVNNDTSD
jgi:uncharacterized SAM-binding protein YcdF (DUF218 family)